MRNPIERPVCHRAEDLVTYLYGEASQTERLDFQEHMHQCDACRTEFGLFNQVHDSIVTWRNEALGTSFAPALASEPQVETTPLRCRESKVSAMAALREFFSVSPLWLRGATAFAGLLLCALVVLTVSKTWQRPPAVTSRNDAEVIKKSDFEAAVAREVEARIQRLQKASTPEKNEFIPPEKAMPRDETARVRSSSKPRVKALSKEESVQLAADLRLIPMDDDEQLFGIVDQPNQ